MGDSDARSSSDGSGLGVDDAPDGYESLARIGQGGFAVVYRGLDTRFDRTVALKILRSDSLDERQLRRFNAECLAIGRVSSHPNIVTVYDAGITRGHRPWLAMEYCSGGSLGDRMTRQGPLPVAEVVSIGARLCGALGAAHEAGVLHHDIKPRNVLLTSYGEPALADFGIATVLKEDDTSGLATGTAAYTVVHAAPEVLEGLAGTEAADIYSLGSTLYTLLAGHPPFAREAGIGLAPLVARILRGDLPVIARSDVPTELEQLLRECMAARTADRPASAAELGAALASLDRRFAADQAAHRRSPASDSTGPYSPPTFSPTSSAATYTPTSSPASYSPATYSRATTSPVRSRQGLVGRAITARALMLGLGGVLGLLLAVFTAWGPSFRGSGADPIGSLSSPAPRVQNAASPAQAAGSQAHAADSRARPAGLPAKAAANGYAPKGLAVSPGEHEGELVVTWRMPTRPDVVATVIFQISQTFQEAGSLKSRAIVSYDNSPSAAPRATLRGLPSRHQFCLAAAHLVSLDGMVTTALSHPVCAMPR